jgi:hypothetical protein
MNVNTSSVGPIVTFVTTGEFTAEIDRLYGICPPKTRKPTGWHVSARVTFVTMVMFVVGAGGRQEAVVPAGVTGGEKESEVRGCVSMLISV